MRILVVGSGAREHALSWKLSQEAEVVCVPGNPGIAQVCEVSNVSAANSGELVRLSLERNIGLVVVGPEAPLIDGLSDALCSAGIPVFGPTSIGAKHEADKIWSKRQMIEAGVPTATAQSFNNREMGKEFVRARFDSGFQVVVKASGPAQGKGVTVCEGLDEALEAVDGLALFGEAGQEFIVEDRLSGREFSLLTLVSGGNFWSCPVIQDYKRIGDGDTGPNTGGMGSYSPVSWLDPSLVSRAEEEIVAPMVAHMVSKGIDYRGCLFSGVMVQGSDLYCLEYNVRFGDPETQSLVMRLGPGLSGALAAVAGGGGEVSPPVMDNAVVSVVLASEGYPGNVHSGHSVTLPPIPDNVQIFHSGTRMSHEGLVTSGGRVVTVSASAATVGTARETAYRVAQGVDFFGKHFRRDIASI
ncbi:MAG: phosphoribosylamine--glycine ligase [Chthonomonadaceae bacterium]|nr:phosphoribosylamine--glycine ligase [Chthonomonadaceae bacterium]